MKILIAEDEMISRCMLESVLTDWGHEVVAVEDGLAAWEALQAPGAPRLAILDWEMPGLVGPEICRRARARPIAPPPYLLLLTARDGREHIAAGLQAGANDYLTKPFDPNELRVRLDVGVSLLELAQLEAASRELEGRVRERTAELAQAYADNERLLAAIASVFVSIDSGGRVTKWNKAAADLFALPADRALGQPFAAVPIPWEDGSAVEQVLRCGRENRQIRLKNVPFARPETRCGYLDLCVTPVPGPDEGGPAGVLVLGEDRTEQRHLEMQLAQAHKLESIGQLAAGIAHEINTPIQYVGDNASFLRGAFDDLRGALRAYDDLHGAARRGTLPPDLLDRVDKEVARADLEFLAAEIPQAIAQSLEGLGRVAKIVRAMKEFSHPGGEDKTAVDLNHAIDSTITVARNEWKSVAEVQTDFDPELPPVPCLAGELNQVVLNLLINAAHAIAERGGPKGRITVSTRRDGGQVEVRVADTGCGIPEAARAKVFDPFFTTKAVGKGTGQGLAIAHAVVVKRHGGTIRFDTEVGHGTTFIIRLPLNAGGA